MQSFFQIPLRDVMIGSASLYLEDTRNDLPYVFMWLVALLFMVFRTQFTVYWFLVFQVFLSLWYQTFFFY